MLETESWLNTDVGNSEIFSEEWNVYHKDRSCTIGGGVLIAVEKIFFLPSSKLSVCELFGHI